MPSTWDLDCRRPDREPGAHALHAPVAYLCVEKLRLGIRARINRPRAVGRVNKGSYGRCITVLVTGANENPGIFSYSGFDFL